MSIFSELLFHHGHITNVDLARSLANRAEGPAATVRDDGHAAVQERRERRGEARRKRLVRAMTALSPFR
ncbi:MAG TPA: hypothetical protein DDZ67_04345 [Xanthomonadaceae bacterium]|nr:hypothetical protein [Xanthomonadaceae bacterium]